MTKKQRSITHGSFTLERVFPNCTPARAFAAFATPEGKAKWFAGPKWEEHKREFDFRVGGREIVVGKHGSGTVSSFEARYYDIVADERIIYSYEMHLDDNKISVSIATLEFKAEGESCRLTMHEDGAFLDGYDGVDSRRKGTEFLLDTVARVLG